MYENLLPSKSFDNEFPNFFRENDINQRIWNNSYWIKNEEEFIQGWWRSFAENMVD